MKGMFHYFFYIMKFDLNVISYWQSVSTNADIIHFENTPSSESLRPAEKMVIHEYW